MHYFVCFCRNARIVRFLLTQSYKSYCMDKGFPVLSVAVYHELNFDLEAQWNPPSQWCHEKPIFLYDLRQYVKVYKIRVIGVLTWILCCFCVFILINIKALPNVFSSVMNCNNKFNIHLCVHQQVRYPFGSCPAKCWTSTQPHSVQAVKTKSRAASASSAARQW